jgi:hypothetical protein
MNADKPALARIYAQNSIRNKHMAERYLRMASQLESMNNAQNFLKQTSAIKTK